MEKAYTVADYRKVAMLYQSCNALYNAVWLWNEICGIDSAFHPETATVAEELQRLTASVIELMAYSLKDGNPGIFLGMLTTV